MEYFTCNPFANNSNADIVGCAGNASSKIGNATGAISGTGTAYPGF